MRDETQELRKAIKKAENLHGHLGPFLVIGVRMGKIAQKILEPKKIKNKEMRATAKIPLKTPYSCILDGIQATTNCTIGNQKLKIESSKEITARFELQEPARALNVRANPSIIENLMKRISEGAQNEELAWEIAHMPENQLFTIEN